MKYISRLYIVAGDGSCKPVLRHPIPMSIIFDHYKQLDKIGEDFYYLGKPINNSWCIIKIGKKTLVNYSSCCDSLGCGSYVFRIYQKRNHHSSYWNNFIDCSSIIHTNTFQLDNCNWLLALANMGCIQTLSKIECRTNASQEIKISHTSHQIWIL